MVGSRSSAALLPPGLIIGHVRIDDGGVAAAARSRDVGSVCPGCGKLSRRVHSRYVRSLADLPAHGRREADRDERVGSLRRDHGASSFRFERHSVPSRPAMRVGIEISGKSAPAGIGRSARPKGRSAGQVPEHALGRCRQMGNHRGLHGSLLWQWGKRARLCAPAVMLSTPTITGCCRCTSTTRCWC